MINNCFMKEYIREFDGGLNQIKKEAVIYRIISIDNLYYYAEEISTGCIFPIYNFETVDNSYTGGTIFHTQSNVKIGKYFCYCPLVPDNTPFKFNISKDKDDMSGVMIPSVREVNSYLKEKSRNSTWKDTLKRYEQENKYFCDIEVIKQILMVAKEKDTLSQIELPDEPMVKYETYVPDIDLNEISVFGYDLSTQEDLCNLVGREEEIKKIIKTTCLGIESNSVLLLGPSGSGKTAIIEQIARSIKNKENEWLQGKIIFCLDTASLISGTNLRGEFEKRFQNVINFCVKYKERIILFIDEIHTLYGLGRTEDSSIDAMNILKPYISRGVITIIGTTTREEYNKYMANDPAFLRRLELVNIPLADEKMNTEIIVSYIKKLENTYRIKLDMDECRRVELAKYIVNITDPKNQKVVGDVKVTNPTVSKNIIKDAFREAIYNKKTSVTLEEIYIALLSCNKLSRTFRKSKAEYLKEKLITTNKTKEESEEVRNEHLKLVRIK